MTDLKGAGLTLKHLAKLHQMTTEEILKVVNGTDLTPPRAVGFKRRFGFADALEIELARQMNDKSGVPLAEAFRLLAFTTAAQSYLVYQNSDRSPRQDFWLAVLASRNTWGSEPRGSWPVTSFGPKEYWAETHYAGSLGTIIGEISEWIGHDQVLHPDSDPARILLANVSVADRRLRSRAADLGITFDDQ